MIFVNKDRAKVPASLNSKLTDTRRKEIIELKKFPSGGKYNSRYKKEDVKNELRNLYRSKCAFCEQKIERFDVEHFRPKSIYFWLAYSWDNLLLACPVCNGNKTNHFKTLKTRVAYSSLDYNSIHQLSIKYDKQEKSLFFNPESENPETYIFFEKNGKISSENEKLRYTIESCKLNRPYLLERRKRIFDQFIKRQNELYLNYLQTKNVSFLYELKTLRKFFKQDALDKENEFLAFRRKMIKLIGL